MRQEDVEGGGDGVEMENDNIIWFDLWGRMDSQSPFSERGEGERGGGAVSEEDRGGWRRWAECEQWGCGVHLALEPWDGLTAAGGGTRLFTLVQFCSLFLPVSPSFSLSLPLIPVYVRPAVSIAATYGPLATDSSGRAETHGNDKKQHHDSLMVAQQLQALGHFRGHEIGQSGFP